MTINSPQPLLTVEIGLSLFSGLKQICERREEFKNSLMEVGFSAFLPRISYLESFCVGKEECGIHRKCRIETSKEILFNSVYGLSNLAGTRIERYRSPFLQSLRAERDQINGCTEDDLEKIFPLPESWLRAQFDPCERRRAATEIPDSSEFDRMLNEEARQRRSEVKEHIYDLANQFDVSREGRSELIIAAALKYGAELGFTFSKSKSTLRQPAVLKQISKDWDIRWIVPSTSQIGFSPFASSDNWRLHNHIEPLFILCPSNCVRPTGTAGELFVIGYNSFLPEFGNGYNMFFDNNELEHIIRAHFKFIGLAIDEILTVISTVITR